MKAKDKYKIKTQKYFEGNDYCNKTKIKIRHRI